MLPFEDNALSKIGVRFDKPIPDGVNFGGLCDDGHGFFCKGIAHLVLLSFSFNLSSSVMLNLVFFAFCHLSLSQPVNYAWKPQVPMIWTSYSSAHCLRFDPFDYIYN